MPNVEPRAAQDFTSAIHAANGNTQNTTAGYLQQTAASQKPGERERLPWRSIAGDVLQIATA